MSEKYLIDCINSTGIYTKNILKTYPLKSHSYISYELTNKYLDILLKNISLNRDMVFDMFDTFLSNFYRFSKECRVKIKFLPCTKLLEQFNILWSMITYERMIKEMESIINVLYKCLHNLKPNNKKDDVEHDSMLTIISNNKKLTLQYINKYNELKNKIICL